MVLFERGILLYCVFSRQCSYQRWLQGSQGGLHHASSDGSRPLSPDMQMHGSSSNLLSQGRAPSHDRLPDYPRPSSAHQSGYSHPHAVPQGGFPPMQHPSTHLQQQQQQHLQQQQPPIGLQQQQQLPSGLMRERGLHNGPAHRQGSDQGGLSQSRGGNEVEPGSVPLQGRAASGLGPSQSGAAAAGGGEGPSQDHQVRQRMMSALVARLSKEQRQALSEMSPQQQVTSPTT